MPNETNRTIHPTAPQPVNPNYPMAALDLTGGQKFGWLALGFLSGITGILIAWLTNAGNPQMRSSAVKFAIIGFAINSHEKRGLRPFFHALSETCPPLCPT